MIESKFFRPSDHRANTALVRGGVFMQRDERD